jgi:fluoride exporter
MNKWLLLSVGGIAGTFLRYAVARWVPSVAGAGFPYGTLAINLSASLDDRFLRGVFDVLYSDPGIGELGKRR